MRKNTEIRTDIRRGECYKNCTEKSVPLWHGIIGDEILEKSMDAELAELLKKRRKEMNLSRPQLAKEIKVHSNTIYNIEKQRHPVSSATLKKICEALDIKISIV